MIRWIIFLWIYQISVNATPSTCILEGVPEFSTRTTYQLKTAIKDTYRGELAIYRTKNIQRVKILENRYFKITWQKQILILATGENFDKFELESGYTVQPSISVMLHFDCTQDNEKDFIIVQNVNDTNNHNPELNQNDFTYTFGMTVPKGFVFTDLIPIKAFDHDVSNGQIYFDIPSNDYVQIQRKGTPRSYSLKEFSTRLVALKDITAPFNHQFNLSVTDGDNPSRQISSVISVIVTTPEKLSSRENLKVFQKNLYQGLYRPKLNLKMEEKISINNEAGLTLKQRGYENHFNISLRNSEVFVNNVKPLPFDIFKLDFIIIELDAFDKSSLRLRGRTAILVQFPGYTESGKEFNLVDFSSFSFVILVVIVLVITLLRKKVSSFVKHCLSKEKNF